MSKNQYSYFNDSITADDFNFRKPLNLEKKYQIKKEYKKIKKNIQIQEKQEVIDFIKK